MTKTYKDIRLDEEPRTFYRYRAIEYDGTILIDEVPILMEKWREERIGHHPTTDYYKPTDTTLRIPPIMESELGTLYNGTDMILDHTDKDYYIKTLSTYYKDQIVEYEKSIEYFKACINELDNYVDFW